MIVKEGYHRFYKKMINLQMLSEMEVSVPLVAVGLVQPAMSRLNHNASNSFMFSGSDIV